MAQRVTPVESHGPSEAALLVVNSRVSHKKDMDIMGHNVCGWCVVFCRAQKLEQHPGSLEPAVGLQSWANYLDKNVFFAVRNVLGFVRSQIGTTHACINLLPDLRPRIQREREKASRIIGGLGKARESGCTCPKVPP